MPGAACLRAAAFVIALPLGLGLFIVVIFSILWYPFLFLSSVFFLSGRLVWCSDPSRLHFLVSTLFNLYIYVDDHPQ